MSKSNGGQREDLRSRPDPHKSEPSELNSSQREALLSKVDAIGNGPPGLATTYNEERERWEKAELRKELEDTKKTVVRLRKERNEEITRRRSQQGEVEKLERVRTQQEKELLAQSETLIKQKASMKELAKESKDLALEDGKKLKALQEKVRVEEERTQNLAEQLRSATEELKTSLAKVASLEELNSLLKADAEDAQQKKEAELQEKDGLLKDLSDVRTTLETELDGKSRELAALEEQHRTEQKIWETQSMKTFKQQQLNKVRRATKWVSNYFTAEMKILTDGLKPPGKNPSASGSGSTQTSTTSEMSGTTGPGVSDGSSQSPVGNDPARGRPHYNLREQPAKLRRRDDADDESEDSDEDGDGSSGSDESDDDDHLLTPAPHGCSSDCEKKRCKCFECRCGKVFSCHTAMYQHAYNYKRKPGAYCHLCGKPCRTNSTLIKHLQRKKSCAPHKNKGQQESPKRPRMIEEETEEEGVIGEIPAEMDPDPNNPDGDHHAEDKMEEEQSPQPSQ